MRNDALIRVLSLRKRLQAKRATLRELSDEFKVHQRTIRRDLEALSLAGEPVRNTADAVAGGFHGFWWVERDRA